MTIHIVGLGPGALDLVTAGTARLLESGLPVILRTRHHPAVRELGGSDSIPSCDDLYRAGEDFTATYEAIASRVVAAAERGDIVFAVPGNPLIAERSVTLLLQRAEARGIPTIVHPALGYADVAATALGQDLGNVQLCDALDLRIDTQRPALISQVYDRDTAAALKLSLLEIYPAEHEVVHLRALGTGDATVNRLPLAGLDHAPFGHLDTVFVPPIPPVKDVRRFDGLQHIVWRLHQEDGCPWDREQTHASLRQHLLEEAYECLEAIDSGDPARLIEELGDVLLQVLMHAAVAEREAEYTLGDVTEHIARKLIRRHPHVFSDTVVESAEQAWKNWDALKKAEKPGGSILEGVPLSLPALAASQALQGRARRTGFDWPDIEGPLEKLQEEVGEFARAEHEGEREAEFGDILFVITNIADRLGVDAEQALRGANARFRERFSILEAMARERGLDLHGLDLAGLDALWDEAKARLRAS